MRAFAQARFKADAAARLFNHAFGDCQAQARALTTPGPVAADEWIEDLAQFLRIDARAAVEYAQHHVRCVGVAGHRRCHLDLVTAVAQGVLHQVGQ